MNRHAAANANIQRRKGGRAGEGGRGWTASSMLKAVWIAALVIALVFFTILVNISEQFFVKDASLTTAGADEAAVGQDDVDEAWEPHQEEEAPRRAEKVTKKIQESINTAKSKTTNEGGNNLNQELPSASSSTEQLISQWLQKQQNIGDPSDPAALSELLSTPQYFTPGSLPLSQLTTLQQCYTDQTIYSKHFNGGLNKRVPYSKKHELAYLLIPKSGSSTGRFMMEHEFDATEQHVKITPQTPQLKNVIAFVREPLSRFYSQYDEAFVRTAPWQSAKHKRDGHPFPYLHEGMHSYHDYEDVFCPPSTRSHRRDCVYRASTENGTLSHRLERFVMEYDGRTPFDIHLALQVPLLSDPRNGRSIFITELHNTTNAEEDWNTIAKRYLGGSLENNAKKNTNKGDVKQSGGVIQGRSYPRRFDKTLVGKESERRICELALLDYCCLNFPLPEVCRNSGSHDNNAFTCKMDYDEENGGIRIQPGMFPEGGRKGR